MSNRVVSREEWIAARKELLKKEKAFTRQRDEMSQLCRDLPRVKVDKSYVFDGPNGKESLSDLFAGRSQLVIKHFMFGPDWKEGCFGCSFGADHLDGMLVHLEHHDVSLVMVSRAPLAVIQPFQRRMGWKLKWVSSSGNDFNYDYHVSFTPEEIASGKVYYNYAEQPANGDEASGLSFFYKDQAGDVFHTYSTYARGDEGILGIYAILDVAPLGRNETGANHNLADWVRLRDRYEPAGLITSIGRIAPANTSEPCCHSDTEKA